MTALWGTLVNSAAVILGCTAGLLLPRMPDRVRDIIMQGMGLAVLFLGVSMGIKTENFILVVISLALGGVAGELIRLDSGLKWAGKRLEDGVKRVLPDKQGKNSCIAQGFVTTTLIYCVGAMAVLGALDGGLRGDHTILYTKALLDGITAMVFATTLGVGVAFSAVPIFIYQGAIALSAKWITSFISAGELDAAVTELSAVGGILIAGIGISILGIKKINVVNLLPSIFVAAGLVLVGGRLNIF